MLDLIVLAPDHCLSSREGKCTNYFGLSSLPGPFPDFAAAVGKSYKLFWAARGWGRTNHLFWAARGTGAECTSYFGNP